MLREEARRRVENNIGSLEDLCKEAICTADLNLMLEMGFPEEASKRLCAAVRKEAVRLKIKDLRTHYEWCRDNNRSSIINTIVRTEHKIYFASRANLHPIHLLEHLEGDSNDICAVMFKNSIRNASECMKIRRETLSKKKEIQMLCDALFDKEE